MQAWLRSTFAALLTAFVFNAFTWPWLPVWAMPGARPLLRDATSNPHLWRTQAQKNQAAISAAKTVAIAPAEDTPLAIHVGPADAIPRSSFVRVRGLPPGATLSEGFAIAPGLWAVPLNGLPKLLIRIPAALADEARLTLSLVTVDGKVYGETSLTLVKPERKLDKPAGPPAETAATTHARSPAVSGEPQARSAPAVADFEAAPAAVDLQQARALVAKGNEKLAGGNIAAARMFFRRAADAGLAEGAFALATTYDPEELSRLKVVGLKSDTAAARHWYERAHALGAKGVEERLVRLDAH
jgi:hypothetical protein